METYRRPSLADQVIAAAVAVIVGAVGLAVIWVWG